MKAIEVGLRNPYLVLVVVLGVLVVGPLVVLFLPWGKPGRDGGVDESVLRDAGRVRELDESWRKTDDPRRDGWPSEVFSAAAGRQLAKLSDTVTTNAAAGIEPSSVVGLVTDEFSCNDLVPSSLETVSSR